MGPPAAPAKSPINQSMYGFNAGMQRPNVISQPYRDPEFSDEEYNRGKQGVNNMQSQYNLMNDPYNRNTHYNSPPPPQNFRGVGNSSYDNQFQQMSSNTNRRMM
jgi:hypothetical protein